jgi:hypothetical protein
MADDVSLFTAPLETITFDDIKAFCDLQLEECETIEYKGDESSKGGMEQIVKCISAMANTDGGIILIGVPERRLPDRKTGLPDYPKGFIPSSNVKSRITSMCHACMEPPFTPEISPEISTDDPDKKVFVIRIDKEKVPILPIYHRKAGILVRFGEECVPAHPSQIRVMFEENEREQNQFTVGHLRDSNGPGFCWCDVGVQLPKKRFAKAFHWNDQLIHTLKKVLQEHKVSMQCVWINKYMPQPGMPAIFHQGRVMAPKRTLNTVEFSTRYPQVPNPQSDNYWLNLYFDTNGFIGVTIGFNPSLTPLYIENLTTAVYAIVDLVCQQELRGCYQEIFWDIGQYQVYCHINQLPGKTQPRVIKARNPVYFPSEGDQSVHLQDVFDALDPEKISKHFTSLCMASLVFLDFEETLTMLNVKKDLFSDF